MPRKPPRHLHFKGKVTQAIWDKVRYLTTEKKACPTEVNAVLDELFGVKLGRSTIYAIKHGRYPRPEK